MTQFDILMITFALLIGFYLDNYEAHNPCPEYCKINHNHRIKKGT